MAISLTPEKKYNKTVGSKGMPTGYCCLLNFHQLLTSPIKNLKVGVPPSSGSKTAIMSNICPIDTTHII